MNRYRKFVTSSVGFTFVVVGVTGVFFKFFFKTHPLEEIHGWGDARDLAKAFCKDANAVFATMKNDGLHVDDADNSVEDLARENQKSPEAILAYFAN